MVTWCISLTISLDYMPQILQSPSCIGIINKYYIVLIFQAVLWKRLAAWLYADRLELGIWFMTSCFLLSCSPVCGIWLLMFQPCFDRILICVISVSDILQHSNFQRLPWPVGEATSEVMPPRDSVSSGIFVLFRPWSWFCVCIRFSVLDRRGKDTKGRGRWWQGCWILPVFTLAYC